MAIDRPEADRCRTRLRAAAQRRMSDRRLSCLARNGRAGALRDLSRGAFPQGKKVAGRHCGIGGRGEAVLRSVPAIEEAAWGRHDPTALNQGRTHRTPAIESVRHVKANLSPDLFRLGLGLSPRHRKSATMHVLFASDRHRHSARAIQARRAYLVRHDGPYTLSGRLDAVIQLTFSFIRVNVNAYALIQ
jgi:hypothetical protein